MNTQEKGGPRSRETPQQERTGQEHRSFSGLHLGMALLCVIIMGGAVALLMWRGVGSGWWLLPMVLCVGAHLLLHRGHSK